MDNEYVITPTGDLCHWGIKGQKWGVRRYQNPDGSLTPAGRKRYAEVEANLKTREQTIKNKERTKAKMDKLAIKKAELDAREDALKRPAKAKPSNTNKSAESDAPKTKSVKDMSDNELREQINRLQLEKSFYDAQRSLAMVNPKQVSAGQKFLNSVMNDVLVPAAKNTGREWVEKMMKDKLGLNKKDLDPIAKVKKEYEELNYKKQIKQLEKDMKNLDRDMAENPNQKLLDKEAKLKLEKSIAEAERDIRKARNPEKEKPNWDDKKKELEYDEAVAKAETNRLKRETEQMKAERDHAKATEAYTKWREEERKKKQGGN